MVSYSFQVNTLICVTHTLTKYQTLQNIGHCCGVALSIAPEGPCATCILIEFINISLKDNAIGQEGFVKLRTEMTPDVFINSFM